jgi:NTE family protein
MSDAPSDTAAKRDRDPILIDLALQAGGAHGAFTWGVLDRLLEERRLQIEGISGTSAGAMNAAVLAHGHAAGGRDEGRRCAQTFLSDHAQDLGRRSTFDLDSLLENV